MPPKAFTVSATQRSMSASTVTLQPMPRTSLPVSSAIAFAVATALSPLRSAIITFAPAPENVRAMPSPMFCAPPVTMATWSVMRNCSNASNFAMTAVSCVQMKTRAAVSRVPARRRRSP